ncbi:MAG: bifunctional demethylmenaquinone methyltransferase/2-methoxy-6-polyprenyl-1,4-benzoquinol methylase UbiE [Bacteroidetes bacterium]|nr:bifunctional demethylmenaquinone methyltransferase/2-methoxy-6-polyprenyl-1,4-benzoquinol methylase UbiE [Bacteroidota bacterium]MBS1972947.1 bifunctional demethylmenaquinone methyltransferase/2-methoxy-6-polyprenyl-1,4-benzoquinol methylase UbiE [Bacteroidota bacterium]
MTKYSHDHIVPFKDSGQKKKQQVADMFDRIAFRYDFLNRFLSGGIDVRWRKKAIRELKEVDPKFILDVATGTADVAIMMAKYLDPENITGIDISEGMLNLGLKKIANYKLKNIIDLQVGDSEAINFPEATFDAITVAFGVRNFANLEKGLEEMLRVLKPGGKLVVLEFSKPKQFLFKRFYSLYMKTAAAGIGKWIGKNREAYKYLHESVNAFPEGKDFLDILDKIGYKGTYLKTLSLGICTIYCGRKEKR